MMQQKSNKTIASFDKQQYQRALWENSPIGQAVCELDGTILDTNLAYANLIRRTIVDTLGLNIWTIAGEKSSSNKETNLAELERVGKFMTTHQYPHQEGSTISVKISGVKIQLDNKALVLVTAEAIPVDLAEVSSQYILDRLPQYIFWKDRNSKYLGCNQKFAEIAGKKSPSELLGQTDYEQPWTKEESDWFQECDRRVMEADTPEYDIIESQKQVGGTDKWLKTNKIPMHDAEGNVIGILGTFEDITQRVAAEKQLKNRHVTLEALVEERTEELVKSQNRYERLSFNIPGVIYQFKLDANGKKSFPYMSSGCQQLFGLSVEEIINRGQLLLSMIHPQDIQNFETVVRTSAKTLEPKKWEGRVTLASGEIKWIQSASKPERQPDGSIIWDGLIMDISDRKTAEEEFKKSQQLLKLIFDTLPQRIFWKDKNFNYLGCNQLFAEDAGLKSAAEIVGKNDFDLAWKKSAHSYRLDDELIMAGGVPKINFEESQINENGTTKWLKTSKIPLRNERGQIIGLFGCYENTGDRQQQQKQVETDKDFLCKIINSIGSPVFVQNEDHKWVLINDAFYKFISNFGDFKANDKEELIGKSDYDILSPEQADLLWAKDELVMVTGEADTHEEYITEPDGKQTIILTKKECFQNLQGDTFLVGTILNVTEI